MGSRLATDSGEPDGDWALLASLEEVGNGEIIGGVGGLVGTVSTRTLGVDDTLVACQSALLMFAESCDYHTSGIRSRSK